MSQQQIGKKDLIIGNKYILIGDNGIHTPPMYIGIFDGNNYKGGGEIKYTFQEYSEVQANGDNLTRIFVPGKNKVRLGYFKIFPLPASYDLLFTKKKKGIMSRIGTFMGNKPTARGGTRKNKEKVNGPYNFYIISI